jgi:hypothetical protein
VTIKPGLVARAVLGHLFAVGLQRTERTPLLTSAASFVLDESVEMPTGVSILYWLYPYRRQIAVRDASLLLDFFKTEPVVFWCLKFFPLAFMVTWEAAPGVLGSLPTLETYMLNAGTHQAKVPIRMDQIPHQFWPEASTDNGAVFYGDGAIAAEPRSAC